MEQYVFWGVTAVTGLVISVLGFYLKKTDKKIEETSSIMNQILVNSNASLKSLDTLEKGFEDIKVTVRNLELKAVGTDKDIETLKVFVSDTKERDRERDREHLKVRR